MKIPEKAIEFIFTDLIPTEAKAVLMGLGILPAGFLVWKKRRKKQ